MDEMEKSRGADAPVRYEFDHENQRWIVVDRFPPLCTKVFPKLTDPIACIHFPNLRLSTYDDYVGTEIECPNCGEINVLEEDRGEYSSEGLSVDCRSCPFILAFIHWPTRAEAEAAGDGSTLKIFDVMTARQRRFERTCLNSPDQLPDIEGERFTLQWDLHQDDKKDAYTQIKHNGQVIFTEPAFWEGGFRYGQVARILKDKYGDRLTDVIPTSGGWIYLGGDSFVHRQDAEQARKEIFGKSDV